MEVEYNTSEILVPSKKNLKSKPDWRICIVSFSFSTSFFFRGYPLLFDTAISPSCLNMYINKYILNRKLSKARNYLYLSYTLIQSFLHSPLHCIRTHSSSYMLCMNMCSMYTDHIIKVSFSTYSDSNNNSNSK